MISTKNEISAAPELWRAGPRELVEILRVQEETVRRTLAEQGRVLAEIQSRGPKATFGYGSTAALVVDALHLSYAEAKKRLDRALALNPARQIDGSVLPPLASATGAAAAEGAIGTGQIDAILTVLKAVPATVSADDRDGAEKILADLAREAAPRDIANAGAELLDRIDPDGPEPKDHDPATPLRELHFRQKRDGRLEIKASVDAVTGANLQAALDPLAKPRPATEEGRPDTRSQAQRQGDAFAELLTLALASPGLPTHAGDRTHIVVTIGYDDLRTGIGKACLDLIGDIAATEARLLACECRVIPVVLGTAGEPLDVGRSKRVVTPAQRRALNIRDRGCSFPRCHRRPQQCEAHHLVPWIDGGETNLRNLTLLCGRHHRLVHYSPWEVRMGVDSLPEFIPPDYLDPLRRPRRDTTLDPSVLVA